MHRKTDGEFPHICPGAGCAVCRYEWRRSYFAALAQDEAKVSEAIERGRAEFSHKLADLGFARGGESDTVGAFAGVGSSSDKPTSR